MKQFALGLATAGLLAGVVTLARSNSAPDKVTDPSVLKIESGDKNPWTSLKLNNDPNQFTFAVVSDRTGGHREKVFSRAVQQINMLQPQFVLSVGDLIEGYTAKEEAIDGEWNEFDGYVKRFEMPFFYVPGNHDLANKTMVTKWGERYGKRYYHFTYRDALFLCLCSENLDTDGMGTIDKDQQEWVAKTVDANKDAKWTFVFLHKPIWTAKDLDKNGWGAVEKALAGRKHNVFCGHVHRYQVFERNGTRYYQLATTGGGSRMRGPEYGEFDQVMLITMKPNGPPVLVNVDLAGVLPPDLKLPDSIELGKTVKKKETFPVAGKATLDGKPVAGVTVSFYSFNKTTEKYAHVADGLTDDAGRFTLSTYTKSDGAPADEYAVTVVKTGRGYYDGEQPEKSLLPEKYATPTKTPLKVTVKAGANDVNLDLTAK